VAFGCLALSRRAARSEARRFLEFFTDARLRNRLYSVTELRLCVVVPLAALLLTACAAETDCDLVKRRDFPSPDRKHTAVVFDMNCYNTTGFYPIVSVLHSGQKLGKNGNVFGAGPEDSFIVTWTTPTNLTVECSWRDRPLPQDKAVEGVAIHFTSRAPRDDLYFNRSLVLARHFVRTNGLAPEFADTAVKRRGVFVDPDTGFFSLGLSVANRFEIDLGEHAGTNQVDSFVDTEGMRIAFSAEGKAAAIAGTNLMSESDALALATTMFHRQGHREPDFHPVQTKRMTTEPGPGNPRSEFLPCYVMTWIPRTLKLPANNDSPTVAVIVSGIRSNIVAYAHRMQ
jgi:hypothetical protein